MARIPAYQPQLAQLVKTAPAGPDWIHELKYDGYRIGCRIDRGRATLISRNGKDWTEAFPEIAEAAARLKVTSALVDGEVCVVLPDGRTSFQALQNLNREDRRRLVYFVFDLLFVDGTSLVGQPLDARKQALRKIVRPSSSKAGPRIQFADHLDADGAAAYREACRLGLEGIVSKLRNQPYQSGKRTGWVKTKCSLRQEFVIGGFTDPEGAREGIGALLVGTYEDEGRALAFAGKVGTGFTTKVARELRARLNRLETRECPFTPRPAGWLGKNAHWVKPELVGEVVFTEWTDEGKIRHPSFQGLREDKSPQSVIREAPAAPPAHTAPAPAARAARSARSAPAARGISISNPDRVMFPSPRLTKLDVVAYYDTIADAMMPHVDGRPLTLVRCGSGIQGDCIYMKHSKLWAPAALTRVKIKEKTKIGDYLVIESPAAIIALAQMDVLEIHTWNTRYRKVECPDRIVLDLDPGPEVTWRQVVAAARLVRGLLQTLGLESWAKTTGGRGLHVVVPIEPRLDWSVCLDFARAAADALVRHDPRQFTTNFSKRGRERLILVDYMRNNRTNTSIAAFSTRAREGAPVSVPVSWEDLSPKLDPASFTVQTVPRRLERQKQDPWRDYFGAKQRLSRTAIAALDALAP